MFILLHEKLLQFDWLRAGIFQLNKKYLGKFVPLASQSLYPIIVYSATNYRPHLRHFWANMYFLRQSQLSHFLFL